MPDPKIVYRPHPDVTPEGELNALAAIYRFILFERSARNEGGIETTLDDGTKSMEDSADAVRK